MDELIERTWRCYTEPERAAKEIERLRAALKECAAPVPNAGDANEFMRRVDVARAALTTTEGRQDDVDAGSPDNLRRRQHDNLFPSAAVRTCVSQGNLSSGQHDYS